MRKVLVELRLASWVVMCIGVEHAAAAFHGGLEVYLG